jgi:hypothetical protein
MVNSTFSGTKPDTTFKIAVAEELERRLPEMPRSLFSLSLYH